MTDVDDLAHDLGTTGRTLRRAVTRGMIRHVRPGARRINVLPSERLYLRRHWPLLRSLVDALRTVPNARLAVLFGSVARGDGRPDSDLDVLVSLRDGSYPARGELVDLLEEACGMRVQLILLEQAEEAPFLLEDALRDGRVLVDRDGEWSHLESAAPVIADRARAAATRLERRAWAIAEARGSR